MAIAVCLPEEVLAQPWSVDEHSATRRAERFSGAISSRATPNGARVPSFLAGCESPQSMRCAAFHYPPAQVGFQPCVFFPMAYLPCEASLPSSPSSSLQSSPPLSARASPPLCAAAAPATPPLMDGAKKKKKDSPPRPNEVTVLLRNIPHDLAPTDLLLQLREYRETVDFLYAPIEFETRQTLGYAFLNFTDKASVARFERDLARLFPDTGAYLQPARVQGQAANVQRFRNSSVMAVVPEDCKPMLFHRGVQAPFPKPTKKLPPLGPRFRVHEHDHE